MTQTEHWDRIRELFEEVSEHPPEARREALQKLCPNDANLQNEILSLLEHDERAEQIGRASCRERVYARV